MYKYKYYNIVKSFFILKLLVERFNFGAVTIKTLLRRFVKAVAVGDSCEANPHKYVFYLAGAELKRGVYVLHSSSNCSWLYTTPILSRSSLVLGSHFFRQTIATASLLAACWLVGSESGNIIFKSWLEFNTSMITDNSMGSKAVP